VTRVRAQREPELTIADHEKKLLKLLKKLSREQKAVFALLCAKRLHAQISADGRFSPYAATAAAASSCLWTTLASKSDAQEELSKCLSGCDAFLQPGIELWAPAEDLLASLVFALELMVARDEVPMRPVWSAFRVYDTLLHHLITVGEEAVVDPNVFWDHPLVRMETERQLRDLADIRRGERSVNELRTRAEAEGLGVHLESRW
jgi:hypothetical protein